MRSSSSIIADVQIGSLETNEIPMRRPFDGLLGRVDWKPIVQFGRDHEAKMNHIERGWTDEIS